MTSCDILTDLMSGRVYAEGSVRYDKGTVDKVAAALDHARQLLQSSMPAVPVVRRAKQVTAAQRDGEFRAFMATALMPPEKPRRKPPTTRSAT